MLVRSPFGTVVPFLLLAGLLADRDVVRATKEACVLADGRRGICETEIPDPRFIVCEHNRAKCASPKRPLCCTTTPRSLREVRPSPPASAPAEIKPPRRSGPITSLAMGILTIASNPNKVEGFSPYSALGRERTSPNSVMDVPNALVPTSPLSLRVLSRAAGSARGHDGSDDPADDQKIRTCVRSAQKDAPATFRQHVERIALLVTRGGLEERMNRMGNDLIDLFQNTDLRTLPVASVVVPMVQKSTGLLKGTLRLPETTRRAYESGQLAQLNRPDEDATIAFPTVTVLELGYVYEMAKAVSEPNAFAAAVRGLQVVVTATSARDEGNNLLELIVSVPDVLARYTAMYALSDEIHDLVTYDKEFTRELVGLNAQSVRLRSSATSYILNGRTTAHTMNTRTHVHTRNVAHTPQVLLTCMFGNTAYAAHLSSIDSGSLANVLGAATTMIKALYNGISWYVELLSRYESVKRTVSNVDGVSPPPRGRVDAAWLVTNANKINVAYRQALRRCDDRTYLSWTQRYNKRRFCTIVQILQIVHAEDENVLEYRRAVNYLRLMGHLNDRDAKVIRSWKRARLARHQNDGTDRTMPSVANAPDNDVAVGDIVALVTKAVGRYDAKRVLQILRGQVNDPRGLAESLDHHSFLREGSATCFADVQNLLDPLRRAVESQVPSRPDEGTCDTGY